MSLLIHLSILSFSWVNFQSKAIFSIPIPQLWRLLTSFLITGSGFGLVFDPYFLFTYSKLLETGSPRFAALSDYVTYVLFVAGIILVCISFSFDFILFSMRFVEYYGKPCISARAVSYGCIGSWKRGRLIRDILRERQLEVIFRRDEFCDDFCRSTHDDDKRCQGMRC